MRDTGLQTAKVVIVGAGPAGLSVARRLAGRVGGDVLVLEREAEPGGHPRQSGRFGYGLRDRGFPLFGPAYARGLAKRALAAGARIMTQMNVTGWSDAQTLTASTPDGEVRIRADVICVATGVREWPMEVTESGAAVPTGRRRDLGRSVQWLPRNEVLRMVGAELDWSSLSPVVDAAGSTSLAGVFAVGNLTHPVETAGVVAREGEHVAARILDYLNGRLAPAATVRIIAEEPVRWISPSVYAPVGAEPALNRFVAWVDRGVIMPTVTVRQDGRLVVSKRVWWPAVPGRAFRIPSSLLRAVDPAGGGVRISIA